MLATLIRKEFLESMLSLRFGIISVLCVIVIPLSFYVNLRSYEQRLSEYLEAKRLYEERMRGPVSMDLQAEGLRPPSPLTIVSIGLEDYLPNKVITRRDEGVQIVNTRGIDNPQMQLLGKVDFVFVVTVVVSLLSFILIAQGIPGEKESGTLRMVLANPVPKSVILLAKFIANYLVLLTPFITSILLGLLVILFSGSVDIFSADHLLRFLLVVGISLLFLAAFFALGLLITSFAYRAATSMISLVFVWVVLALVFPKVSTMLAQVVHPVRSQQLFTIQKSFLKEAIEKERELSLRRLYDQVAVEYGQNPMSVSAGSNLSDFQKAYLQRRETIEEEYKARLKTELERMENDYEKDKSTQENISLNISRLSPISSFYYIVSELTNTGTLEAVQFEEYARRFYSRIEQEVYGRFRVVTFGGTGGASASFTQADPNLPTRETVSRFQYQSASLEKVLGIVWIDIMYLILFTLIFISFAYVRFLKYDVR
jgi:ABC-2 type transport system permease protein